MSEILGYLEDNTERKKVYEKLRITESTLREKCLSDFDIDRLTSRDQLYMIINNLKNVPKIESIQRLVRALKHNKELVVNCKALLESASTCVSIISRFSLPNHREFPEDLFTLVKEYYEQGKSIMDELENVLSGSAERIVRQEGADSENLEEDLLPGFRLAKDKFDQVSYLIYLFDYIWNLFRYDPVEIEMKNREKAGNNEVLTEEIAELKKELDKTLKSLGRAGLSRICQEPEKYFRK